VDAKSKMDNVSRRHFLAVAGGAAAVGSLGVKNNVEPVPASTSVDYPVTIDVTKKPISYMNGSQNVYHLKIVSVNAGDTISWNAISSAPASGGQQHSAGIFFPKDTPLIDDDGRPMYAVVWSDREEALGRVKQKLDSDANGVYEYRVAVFDKNGSVKYSDDPKIMIGTGQVYLANKLIEVKEELQGAAEHCSSDSKDMIATAEHKLNEIINGLKLPEQQSNRQNER
jgi:hypothetical protein